MKVALVIEKMDTSRGGREVSTAGIAENLAARGYEVEILCQKGRLDAPGVKICALGGAGLGRDWKLRDFYGKLETFLRHQDYDLVHSTMPLPGADIYQPRGGTAPARLEASRRRRGPVLGDVYKFFARLDPAKRLIACKEKKVARDEKTLCLPNSEMVAGEFRLHYNRSRRVQVVYNGVSVPDVDESERLRWRQARRADIDCDEDEPVFLTVAKNLELKGVPSLLKAYADWRNISGLEKPGKLVIAGGNRPYRLIKMSGDHGLSGSVIFVSHTDSIFEWYSAADACVHLSWYDACSRVVLEATRWGLPSITTVYNGAAEILGAGAGIVVGDPEDKKAVISALEEMADSKSRTERKVACRMAADYLSLERHVKELVEIYEALAENVK